MPKYTKTTITQLSANEQAALDQINKNFDDIQIAIQDTVSRSGAIPAHMINDLDLNGKRIINAAAPIADNDLVRKQDVNGYLTNMQNIYLSATSLVSAATETAQTAITKAGEAADSATNANNSKLAAKASEDHCEEIESRIGTIFHLLGRKDTYQELPSTGNLVGDMWLVGTEQTLDKEEYVWVVENNVGRWEKIGSTTYLNHASESLEGIAKIATSQDITTGSDNTKIVTPSKLVSYVTGKVPASTVGGTNQGVYLDNGIVTATSLKFEVVTALPASPDVDTIYFVKES